LIVLKSGSEIQSLERSQFASVTASIVFSSLKEKSWSVKLMEGSALDSDGHVRTRFCEDCKSNTELIAINTANPRLVLLGCSDRKCQHRLVKFET
jgi:hypothetical protein